LEQRAEKTQPIAFDVSAADVEDRIVTLTATGLPDGATFVDHGDNTGTFSWTPAFSAFGPYDVSFHADDGAGQTDSSVTRIMVNGTTSLFVDSAPGDVIGEGKLRFFSSTDGRFTPTENFVGGASTR